MERELSVSGACFQLQKNIAGGHSEVDTLPQEFRFSWYWSRKDIENNSPSRKDGVDLKKETQLRMLYCSFLQDIGMRFRVPQSTIATAIMFCHRFYLHQSHAKNEWQTIATACMFLASKVEDTPCYLDKVVRVAYETMYRGNPDAAQRIQLKDVFEKQKALILTAERALLSTIRFDFNIQHPYKPLHEAFRKLQMAQKDVRQTAWNFVNDWLRTTLCLQYKPNYIAAGSLYLAAKHHNVKLPSEGDCVWWQVFDVTPLQLDAVVRQMMDLLGYKRRTMVSPAPEKPKAVQSPIAAAAKEEASSSPESCVLSRDGSSTGSPSCDVNEEASTVRPTDISDQGSNKQNITEEDHHKPRDPESPNGVIEDCQARPEPEGVEHALNKIDVDRIKALLKMRKRNRESDTSVKASGDPSEDIWIERELEAGIEISAKRQKSVDIL